MAYVKTGSFDLVLNEASKRKTASAVSFHDGKRMVGDTAAALVGDPLELPHSYSWCLRAETTLPNQGGEQIQQADWEAPWGLDSERCDASAHL